LRSHPATPIASTRAVDRAKNRCMVFISRRFAP
jgi:hypothetical protein